jgi:hypothetical protein
VDIAGFYRFSLHIYHFFCVWFVARSPAPQSDARLSRVPGHRGQIRA